MQTAQTVRNLRVILFGFTAAMVALSFLCAALYPLRREDVEAVRAQLESRRAAEELTAG